MVLLVLLAIEGVTIIGLRRLLLWHVLIGFLIVPPTLVKVGSTLNRFARYYFRDTAFRQAGPPPWLHRVMGPVVIVTTVAVLATGIELWIFGDSALWVRLHKLTFLAWFVVMAVHVLGRLDRASALALADVAGRSAAEGAITRRNLVVASLVAGAALAVGFSFWPSPFGPVVGT